MSTEENDRTVGPGAPVGRGDLVAGKYVVGGELGRGGMGMVLEARDKLLGRRVAIKFLLPELSHSPRAIQRFIREARVATRITSEHVVRLLEIDTLESGTPFFVMEYLHGHDLKAALAERGPLAVSVASDYLLQALEAIAEGHRLGIVHRDIKPSNLFVTKRADGRPLVKVLDFGIAKAPELDDPQQNDLTGSDETRLGSLPYTSPEQFQSPSKVDPRSDIWALGVTLYELVCGSHPCASKTAADLTLWLVSGATEPPSRRRRDLALPPGFDELVLRCLDKDRDRRFGSAVELATALAVFSSEEARVSLRVIKGLSDAARGEGPDSTLPVVDSLRRHSPVALGQPRSTRILAGSGAVLLCLIALVASGVSPFRTPVEPPPTSPENRKPESAASAPLNPVVHLPQGARAAHDARPNATARPPVREPAAKVKKLKASAAAPHPSSAASAALAPHNSVEALLAPAEVGGFAAANAGPSATASTAPPTALPRNERVEKNIATRR